MDQSVTADIGPRPPRRIGRKDRHNPTRGQRPNALRDWLEQKPKPMSKTKFAALLGVTPSFVSQLTTDEPPWPSRELALRIALVTQGAVTPNDLVGYRGGT